MSHLELDTPQAEMAIQWMVELASGDAPPGREKEFEDWLHADPRNEQAWLRLQEGLMPFGVAARQNLSAEPLTERMTRMRSTRRNLILGFAGLAGSAGLSLAVAERVAPLRYLTADHFTLTAQRGDLRLSDGSRLQLQPRAAIDIDDSRKVIRLLDGEIMVNITPHRKPFSVVSDDQSLVTERGVFILAKRQSGIAVTGIEGHAVFGADTVEAVEPGDRIVYQQGRYFRSTADLQVATAWTDGLLIAKDRTVASIIDEVRPYYLGYIRVDPRVATMRATAVLKLDDPAASIEMLASSLGLRARRISRYWIDLSPTSA